MEVDRTEPSPSVSIPWLSPYTDSHTYIQSKPWLLDCSVYHYKTHIIKDFAQLQRIYYYRIIYKSNKHNKHRRSIQTRDDSIYIKNAKYQRSLGFRVQLKVYGKFTAK